MISKNIALIGVGGHGGAHLSQIRQFESSGAVRLVAVADPFVDKLGEVHAELTGKGVHWYQDYRELLEKEKNLDCLVISTPIPLHEPMLRAALQYNPKMRILLEKPALPTIQQVREFVQLDTSERVRIGYQLIHTQVAELMKSWVCSGALGEIRRIITAACWPRSTTYYERAGWAGKLLLNGAPVFDGPMTNALSHILHEGLYFGSQKEGEFALPQQVQGFLARARRIESYDFVWLRASLGTAEFHLAFAHCAREGVPYSIRVEGTKGSAWIEENGAAIGNDVGLEVPELKQGGKDPLYQSFLAEQEVFAKQPTRLQDVIPCTAVANASLISSGRIFDIPANEVSFPLDTQDDFAVLAGVEDYIRAFAKNPKPPCEAGFSWGQPGKVVDASSLESIDLAAFIEK